MSPREFFQLLNDYPWTCFLIVVAACWIIEAIRGES